LFRSGDQLGADAHHIAVASQHGRHLAIVEAPGRAVIGEHAMNADLAAARRDAPLRSHKRIDARRKTNSANRLRRGPLLALSDPRHGGGDADLSKYLAELDPGDDFPARRVDEAENAPAMRGAS